MGLTVVTAPTNNPTATPVTSAISLTDAKIQLHIDSSDTSHDTDLIQTIKEASDWVENYLRATLITTVYDLTLDRFPTSDYTPIELPMSPVQSVGTVSYVGSEGSLTWASGNYETDVTSYPARLKPIDGGSYPDTKDNTFNTVTVRYTAGFGDNDTDIPHNIRRALKVLVAELWRTRESTIQGTITGATAFTVEQLLAEYRLVTWDGVV